MKKVVAIIALCLSLITMTVLPVYSAVINTGTSTSLTPIKTIPNSVIVAPTGLTATAEGLTTGLTWKDNAIGESGYVVERKSAGSSYIVIAKLNANSTSYRDIGLSANVQYTYRVKAVDSTGSGLYSGEATATTYSTLTNNLILPSITNTLPSLLKPEAPAKLRAVLSGYEADISWLDQSINETGFKLERKTEDTEYTQIALLPVGTTTYKDTNIALSELEKTYTYRVCAFNNAGTSLYSNEYSVIVPPAIVTTTLTTKVIKYRIGQTSYTVNGQVFTMDVPPIIVNNRTYLPIRPVAESLGAIVSWDGDLQQVKIILNSITVEMVVNSNIAKVNGVDTSIDNDPQITPLLLSNRVYVPVAFVASSLGFDVTWDAALQEVILTYPKQ